MDATACATTSTPTPETHRYVGMWRPPWEPLLDDFDSQWNRGDHAIIKGPMAPGGRRYDDGNELRADYLAGHFDVPQYEPKEKADAG